jgi:drug/metabolite transporter (DMT)-like permease
MLQRLPVMVLLLSSIGWGLTWIPIKALQEMGLSSQHLILIAFSAATIALLPWVYLQRKQWLPALWLMLLLGICGGFANVAFQTSMAKGDVVRVTILFYMLPVWSMLGGWWILKEHIDNRRLCALAFCLAGAFSILEAWNISWYTFTAIDALALGSGFGLAACNILFRFTTTIPLISKIGFMFAGSVVLISASFIVIPLPQIEYSPEAIPLAVAYGAGWIILITMGSQWAVTRIEASRSSIIIVMELVVAISSVVIITQSALAIHEIIGGVMVFIAALLEGLRSEKKSIQDIPSKESLQKGAAQ